LNGSKPLCFRIAKIIPRLRTKWNYSRFSNKSLSAYVIHLVQQHERLRNAIHVESDRLQAEQAAAAAKTDRKVGSKLLRLNSFMCFVAEQRLIGEQQPSWHASIESRIITF